MISIRFMEIMAIIWGFSLLPSLTHLYQTLKKLINKMIYTINLSKSTKTNAKE